MALHLWNWTSRLDIRVQGTHHSRLVFFYACLLVFFHHPVFGKIASQWFSRANTRPLGNPFLPSTLAGPFSMVCFLYALYFVRPVTHLIQISPLYTWTLTPLYFISLLLSFLRGVDKKLKLRSITPASFYLGIVFMYTVWNLQWKKNVDTQVCDKFCLLDWQPSLTFGRQEHTLTGTGPWVSKFGHLTVSLEFKEKNTDASNFYNSSIFDPSLTSGFGGWGDPNDDIQVMTGAFSYDFIVSYPSPHRVRRNFTLQPWIGDDILYMDGSTTYYNTSQVATDLFTPASQAAMVNGSIGDFTSFQAIFEGISVRMTWCLMLALSLKPHHFLGLS